MPAWVVPAITAAGSIIGSAVAKGRNSRQISQQDKLNQLAVGANKQMALFNKDLQMQMWEETGPTGQMEQLKKAGLNPGLIYGMGGAGGQTANAAQGQGVAAGQAQGRTGNEEFQATSMGLELATRMGLLNAQKENIEADTELKKADAANKPIQGENIQADTKNKELNAELQQIQNKIAGDTAENAINTARIGMLKADQELKRSTRENAQGDATYQTTIDQIKANLSQTLLQNDHIKAQISKITQEINESQSRVQLNQAQIENMAKLLFAKYFDQEINFRDMRVNEKRQQLEEYNKTTNAGNEAMMNAGQRIIDILMLKQAF